MFAALAWNCHAANLLVSNNNDKGAGSLRQAIADNSTLGGGNTIVFSNTVTGTIKLTTGQLSISNNVIIVGPGPTVLVLDGSASNRLFSVSAATVNISGLTISNGLVKAAFSTDAQGGGVLNSGTLVISNCVINGNAVNGGDGAPAGNGLGGGIYNSGMLTLAACSLANNSARGGNGGSYNSSTPANGGDAEGAGIFNSFGNVIVNASTFQQNSANGGIGGTAGSNGGVGGSGQGGALCIVNGGLAFMTNCTLNQNFCGNAPNGGSSGPRGSALGAGIYGVNSSMVLEHCTISGNVVYDNGASGSSGPVQAAGVYVQGGSATHHNTIIAGNQAFGANSFTPPDVFGSFTSLGFNLIGATDGSSGWKATDYTGTVASPLDPLLGSLATNGGSTSTLIPRLGSPAIDHGTSGGTTIDQRGLPRPFDFGSFPNADGGDGSDIGAVELSPNWLVTTTNDSGAGSLRQAILNAASTNIDVISFGQGLTGTILLTGGELLIGKGLWIDGPGAKVLAISATKASRIFDITNGAVTISGLTIRDGQIAGATGRPGGTVFGGGVYCAAPTVVTLQNCIISNCAAIGGSGTGAISGNGGDGGFAYGGGVLNLGVLTLDECWLVGNQAVGGHGGHSGASSGLGGNGGTAEGGALYTSSTTNVVIRASTLSSNSVTFGGLGGGVSGNGTNGTAYGAGVYSYSCSSVRMVNSTVVSNMVSGAGSGSQGGLFSSCGGIALFCCTVVGNNGDSSAGGIGGSGNTVTNSIIWGNSAVTAPEASGAFTSGGYNIIGNASGSTGFGATGDQLGVNPLLGVLQANGGPTPTMGLLFGSPAIDKGKGFGLGTDQRGALRPFDFSPIANALGGDGSDIGAFELASPRLAITSSPPDVILSWPSCYADFALQSGAALPVSNNWVTVTNAAATVGSQLIVTNSAPNGSLFYRLKSR